MNKTVKTIAWICLVLGILGTALDVTAFIVVRNAFVDRQARFEEFQEQVEGGELPRFRGRPDVDTDGDAKRDGDWGDFNHFGLMAGGRIAHGGNFGGQMPGLPFDRQSFGGSRFGFPLFAAALGPILLVVGSVMLIVNRGPADKNPVGKKETGKKSKKSEK